eukprot:TRINITY_DN4603_c0_g2_i1.p1 TRINITY_DN4603_c0_g2~~TRINITY_DN4603_c0_g2_i1.p1  ORF type:complete len:972 (-),score=196.79 TRINITY_DN4603_c0_g2_i1:127-3042(-)
MNRTISLRRYTSFCFSCSPRLQLSFTQSRSFSTSNNQGRYGKRVEGDWDRRERDLERRFRDSRRNFYDEKRQRERERENYNPENNSNDGNNRKFSDNNNYSRNNKGGEQRTVSDRYFNKGGNKFNSKPSSDGIDPNSRAMLKERFKIGKANTDNKTNERVSAGNKERDRYSNRQDNNNNNNQGLINTLKGIQEVGFDEITPSPLNLNINFSIPPLNVIYPPLMTGDLLEFIQRREPVLTELTACNNTIEHLVETRDIFGTPRKYFLRQASFRIPACDKKIVSDSFRAEDETHFKIKDFSRILGLTNELLKDRVEQDAHKLWESLSKLEKRDISIVEVVDMMFPNALVASSPSTPFFVDLNGRNRTYCRIGSVPWSIYLYATHIFLYRYPQYFRAKEAGIFRCRSPIKVKAILTDLASLDDTKTLAEFIDICKSKLTADETLNTENRVVTPPTIDIFWDIPKFRPFIHLLKWQALLSGYECALPKIVSSLLLPLNISSDSAKIHEALVKIGAIDPHQNIFRMKAEFDAEIKFDFPKKLDKATNSLLEKFSIQDTSKFEGREDMRDHTIFTIDSIDTVEIDDGVSITDDGWFHVHIADPTKWFKPHSDLDIVARHRATSIYLPEAKISMLPLHVSKDVFSILPDRVSYALTFSMKLAKDGHIEEWKIAPSVVQNIRKLDYIDVDCVLDNQYNPYLKLTDKEKDMLRRLYECAVKHNEWRKLQGAFSVNLPEVKIEIYENGKQVKIDTVDQNTKSRMLVSEMMLMCGQCASFFGIQNDIPLPYRFQTAPELSDQVQDYLKTLPENTLPFHQVRFLSAASVSTSPQRHHGVGVDSYVQASSPIRRYGDLLAHFQIKAFLRKRDPPFTLRDMKKIVPAMVDVYKNIKDLQRFSENFWTLRYLHQQGQQMYKALVLGVDPDFGKLSLFLPDVAYRLKMPIPLNTTLAPGQYILLQILKVNLYAVNAQIVKVLEEGEM